VLAYGFIINCQFLAKTDRNSVFLGRDPNISDWLYIMVSYMSFYGFFKKNQILAQNPWVLACGFPENHQFAAKTNRNSIFLGRDPHISNWVYIMVPYMSFTGFQNFQNFNQNP
jgi:hypothetical protein